MKILEELEADRKAVAELEGKELENDLDSDNVIVKEAEKAEEPQEEVKEEVKEEPKAEEKPEVKVEEKKEEEEKPDAAAFARMRRELNALKKQKTEKKEEVAEDPQKQVNDALVEVIQTVREQKAEKEFAILESSFASQTPDYNDVSNQYKAALYNSLRLQNPRKSHAELLDMTKQSLLIKAGGYVNDGLDPIQEMYEEAKMLGFKVLPKEQPKEEAKEEEPKELKPDPAKLAANRARNAGTAGAKGAGGEGQITRAAAAELSVKDWMKLPASEKARLLGGR